MINISTKAELTKILADNAVVMIDFWAEWCGPCKSLAPILEQVAVKTAGKAVIAKINIDTAAELARDYRVRSIPTLLFFKNTELVNRVVGLRSEAELVADLEKNY
ncbi:MAG: thioredoxin [Negativicutes bacterium]|jgi:thioredoxin 1